MERLLESFLMVALLAYTLTTPFYSFLSNSAEKIFWGKEFKEDDGLSLAGIAKDHGRLPMWLDVNGRRMQTGNTDKMIFDCATIVSHLSEFTRLEPGDLICTGTPPGVGMGKTPQVYLNIGDEVRLGIEGLGEQAQKVTAL